MTEVNLLAEAEPNRESDTPDMAVKPRQAAVTGCLEKLWRAGVFRVNFTLARLGSHGLSIHELL